MTRRLTIASLLALTGAFALPAASAQAQCSPNDTFCASIETPHVQGRIRVRRRARQARVIVAPTPPAQVIVTTPPPPPPPRVIVTQPAPPPPPPRVIVTQPAPPPPTQVRTITIETEQEFRLVPEDRFRRRFGLMSRASWVAGEQTEVGGAMVGARVRPGGRSFGLEFAVGAFGGADYNGDDRIEIPATINAMYFIGIGAERRFELYSTIGFGVSWGVVNTYGLGSDYYGDVHNTWVGGEAGLGMEWHVSRHFALDLDMRFMVRNRVASDSDTDEFVRYASDGSVLETTNLSWAPIVNLGGVFYF